MKKFIALLSLLSSITILQAQESIGFRSGISLIQTNNRLMPENLFTIGFSAAIPLKFRLSKRLGFQPEFTFIEKATGGEIPKFTDFTVTVNNNTFAPNARYKYRTSTNTLEIPLLFTYALKQSDKINIGLLCGPSFGYGISVTHKDNIIGKQTWSLKSESQSERVDFDFIFGADIQFKIRGHQFVGDIRYINEITGLIDSFHHENSFEGFNISIGYIYPLK